ncbi:MAG: DUF3570 domain-containing protein [Thiotrichales bacterium]
MQLSQSKPVRAALGAAACALLGVQAARAEQGWEIDSAVLFYSEPDRVTAVEPVVNARKEIRDDEFLNLKLTLDTLTGASANGATASNTVQTFTRPSGRGSYTTQPGETPLDDTFRDTRVALSANWDRPLNRLMRSTLGANVSKEYDYTSLGVSGQLSRDFNDRNTTLSAGVAVASDTIEPEGGIPTAFASMVAAGAQQPRDGTSDDKTTLDLLLGATQVLGKNTVAQLNLSYSQSEGYHTDPFKLLSVVAADSGSTLDYVYENRPDSRRKTSLYAGLKHSLGDDVVNAAYRYYTDDWGLDSHTLDLAYRWKFSERQYLQPRLRYYAQGAADFYRHSLVANAAIPEYATADYRLGEFDATTLGLKYGYTLDNGSEFSIRAEYYLQGGDSHPADAIGIQREQDLFPDVDAYILQANYRFRW